LNLGFSSIGCVQTNKGWKTSSRTEYQLQKHIVLSDWRDYVPKVQKELVSSGNSGYTIMTASPSFRSIPKTVKNGRDLKTQRHKKLEQQVMCGLMHILNGTGDKTIVELGSFPNELSALHQRNNVDRISSRKRHLLLYKTAASFGQGQGQKQEPGIQGQKKNANIHKIFYRAL